MKSIYLIIFLFASYFSFGQSVFPTVSGYVKFISSSHKSAYPAQVKASGATSTSVNSDGYFELKFYNSSPGKDVKIEVNKIGYEVVNTEALIARIPVNNITQQQLLITLRKTGETNRLENKWYEQYMSHHGQDRFDDSLSKAARKIAKRLSVTDFDLVPVSYKRAFEYFISGNLDSAILAIDETNLLAQYENANKEEDDADKLIVLGIKKKEESEKEKEGIIQSLLLDAVLHEGKLDFKNASRIYDKLIFIDGNDPKVVFEVARFYEMRRIYKRSAELYHVVLNKNIAPINRAAALNNLGNMCTAQDSLELAKRYYIQSIRILEDSLLGDLKTETSNLFQYNNLANIYSEMRMSDSAKYFFNKILKIRTEPGSTHESMGALKMTYLNLGVEYIEEDKVDSAEFYFNQALRTGSDADNVAANGNVYYNFGKLFERKGQFKVSLNYYKKGVSLLELRVTKVQRMSRISMQEREQLARFYISLALLNSFLRYDSIASSYVVKYMLCYDTLASLDSAFYMKPKIQAYKNSCSLFLQSDKFSLAKPFCEKSLNFLKRRGDVDDIIKTMISLGRIYSIKNDEKNAVKYCNDAYKLLAKPGNSKKFCMSEAGILNALGVIALNNESFEVARIHFKKALSIMDSCENGSQSEIHANIANACNNLAMVEIFTKCSSETIDLLNRALELYKKDEAGFLYSNSFEIANVYLNLGRAFLKLHRFDSASICWMEFDRLLMYLIPIDKESMLGYYLESCYGLGQFIETNASGMLGLNRYMNALNTAVDYKVPRKKYNKLFFNLCIAIGNDYIQSKIYEQAAPFYEDALTCYELDNTLVDNEELNKIYSFLIFYYDWNKSVDKVRFYKEKLKQLKL